MQHADIASLIPHQGGMCLLERIVEWDDTRIVLETTTHRSPDNPLRVNGKLRAVHLCEYGAQAMAVHGALKSKVAGLRTAPGLLVALRSVSFSVNYIDDLRAPLRIEAGCLQATGSSLQYGFRITHEETLIAEGRAAVILSMDLAR